MRDDPCGLFEEPGFSVQQIGAPRSLAGPQTNDRPPPPCRMLRDPCEFSRTGTNPCDDCAFLDDIHADSGQEIAFLQRCRTIQAFVEQTANRLYSAHAAVVVLGRSGHVVQYDTRGQSFLRNNEVISIHDGKLRCSSARCQSRLAEAIGKTIESGHATNLLVHAVEQPSQRMSVSLVRLPEPGSVSEASNNDANVRIVCLIAPLDRRRFATARQLMELFGLSAAEARLARALCQGDSLDRYAADHGLKMPTVRTQLKSVFAKTATDRQSMLVRLLSAIPVVRETPVAPTRPHF